MVTAAMAVGILGMIAAKQGGECQLLREFAECSHDLWALNYEV